MIIIIKNKIIIIILETTKNPFMKDEDTSNIKW